MRHRRVGLAEIAWIAILIGGYTAAQTKVFRWYVAPIYPVYILLASGAVVFLAEQWTWLRSRAASASRIVIALAAVTMAVSAYPALRHYDYEWAALHGIHAGIVRQLEAHGQPGDVLCTEDIGEVGYVSGLPILDRAGLVSPETVPFNARGDYFGLVRQERPQWLVISPRDPTSGFLGTAAFDSLYVLQDRFAPPRESDWPFELYRLR
jgi:hypothetical protein